MTITHVAMAALLTSIQSLHTHFVHMYGDDKVIRIQYIYNILSSAFKVD